MAVVAMWKCDRDESMFENKKDADAHDKMLELAEGFTGMLSAHLDGIDERDAENLGLLLSRNKAAVIAACKGKPELLFPLGEDLEEINDSNVTQLAAKG